MVELLVGVAASVVLTGVALALKAILRSTWLTIVLTCVTCSEL